MENYGDFRGILEAILTKLKQISLNTGNSACCQATNSAGVNTSIPAGFSSISIVQTSMSGTVDIKMADGTVFSLQIQGEVLVQAVGDTKFLPAYAISTTNGGTWKWVAVK